MASTPAQSLTLISTGLADTRLQSSRGNPDPAQFVKVVRKTTRWAAQWNRIEFDGVAEFGQRVSMTLPRIGHLVSGFTLAVTMPDIYSTQLAAIQKVGGTSLTNRGRFLGPLFGWTNSLGHALIQQIELEIGGTIVETLDGRLLEMLDELYEPLEGVLSKNQMICRAPNEYDATTWISADLTTVYVPIPFWFSRRGVYSHALPIQALTSDIVRIHVTFRPIQELVYTPARVDSRNPPIPTIVDGKYDIRGSQFYYSVVGGTKSLYSFNADMPPTGLSGEIIPMFQMPTRFSPVDAYALVEYIFLEDYEALAFRTGELTYHVEQHIAVPMIQTQGMKEIRIPLPYTNPTKEILWVFQRPEVTLYNSWFLFTRDLAAAVAKTPPTYGVENPCLTPWWPDASLVPSGDKDWCIRPAFQTSYSEPLESATLMYNSYERCVHEGGSFFRGVVPAMMYTKSAVINRYIYAYSFGARAATQAAGVAVYEPTGVANWDKIPRKELYLRLTNGRRGMPPPDMNVYMYVTIWNVFKVFGGRGGMLFTN
jgi:hypothetical protein